jgi:hypothetical protein
MWNMLSLKKGGSTVNLSFIKGGERFGGERYPLTINS